MTCWSLHNTLCSPPWGLTIVLLFMFLPTLRVSFLLCLPGWPLGVLMQETFPGAQNRSLAYHLSHYYPVPPCKHGTRVSVSPMHLYALCWYKPYFNHLYVHRDLNSSVQEMLITPNWAPGRHIYGSTVGNRIWQDSSALQDLSLLSTSL